MKNVKSQMILAQQKFHGHFRPLISNDREFNKGITEYQTCVQVQSTLHNTPLALDLWFDKVDGRV